MEHFYDAQIKRYLTQFMRAMSGYCYMDAKGQLVQVPVRYGDMNRQVASIINKNSENIMQSAPFIACYIKDLKFDRARMQDPTYVSKLQIRERAYNEAGSEYLNYQGANYTVERLMPTPYMITFNADIWTTNLDQKLQLWEQITVLFNPSIELQTTDNYIDWTSLSVLELTDGTVFESRTVPQGISNDLSIATLQFSAPVWITPPAKIKKLGIITKIINNIFAEPTGSIEAGEFKDIFAEGNVFGGMTPDARVTVTHKDYDLLVLNNTAVLVPIGEQNVSDGWVSVDQVPYRPSWMNLLDIYPGIFKAGYSQIRLGKLDKTEIVATISLHPANESLMVLSFDAETIPTNTTLVGPVSSLGTISAIVNPHTFNPGTPIPGTRYLILEDIMDTTGWGLPLTAAANDIIEFDGVSWITIFNSAAVTDVTYITNNYTGIQYKWDGTQWTKSFEGIYTNENWRLIL